MTANEIVTAVKQRVVNLTNATFTDAWYLDRVNQGYRDLATFYDPQRKQPLRFPHFQTTRNKTIAAAMSTNVFAVSDADIFSVTALWDLTNGRDVPERAIRELELINPTLTGPLLKYAIVGTGVGLALRIYKIPTVSTSIRLGVYLYPEALVTGGVAPIIPEVWHKAIELFAAMDAADKQGLPDRRAELRGMVIDEIRSHRSPTQETRRRKRRMSVWRRHYPTHPGRF